MNTEKLTGIAIKDPLSETTRKERMSLLGLSIVTIGIIKTGTIPTKIAALGIEFSHTDQKYLFYILAAVVFYYLVAFSLFALSDFISWRIAFADALNSEWEKSLTDSFAKDPPILSEDKQRIKQLEAQILQMRTEQRRQAIVDTYGFDFSNWGQPLFLIRLSSPLSVIRAAFEFALPLIVGVYALVLLLINSP